MALNTMTPTIVRWNAFDSIRVTIRSRLVTGTSSGREHELWTLRDLGGDEHHPTLRRRQQSASITGMTVLSRTAARQFARQFAAAVDRLADARPSQRVGALHTLTLLGQNAPAHRPAIVDVICAFLRGPATDAAVRMTAQQLLGSIGALYI